MLRGRFRWVVVFLLFAITVINYIDRSAIAYAVPDIESELGLGSARMGLVLGAFGVGYAVTTLIGGIAVDRYGAKIVLAVAALAWTLAIGATGLAVGFLMLYAARVVLGLAEGPNFPAMTGAVGGWLPPHERATALGNALVAVPLALAVGAPAVSWLIYAAGWRETFFVLAALGFLWLPLWLIFYRDRPADSPFVDADERALIAAPAGTGATDLSRAHRHPWRSLLTTPTLLANYWAFFVFGYFLFFFMTWLPTYLHDVYGLHIVKVGFVAALPWLAAAAGIVLLGLRSDRILQRSGSLRLSRTRQIAATQLVAALAVIPVALIDNLVVAVAGITVAVGASMAANAAYYAVNVDLVPERAGTALGIMDFAFALSGFAAPVVTGFVHQASGRFSAAFLLMAVLAASSVVVVMLFHHPDRDRERLRSAAA